MGGFDLNGLLGGVSQGFMAGASKGGPAGGILGGLAGGILGGFGGGNQNDSNNRAGMAGNPGGAAMGQPGLSDQIVQIPGMIGQAIGTVGKGFSAAGEAGQSQTPMPPHDPLQGDPGKPIVGKPGAPGQPSGPIMMGGFPEGAMPPDQSRLRRNWMMQPFTDPLMRR